MGTPATLITKGLTIRRHEHVGLQQRYVFYERSHRVPGTHEKVIYIYDLTSNGIPIGVERAKRDAMGIPPDKHVVILCHTPDQLLVAPRNTV